MLTMSNSQEKDEMQQKTLKKAMETIKNKIVF